MVPLEYQKQQKLQINMSIIMVQNWNLNLYIKSKISIQNWFQISTICTKQMFVPICTCTIIKIWWQWNVFKTLKNAKYEIKNGIKNCTLLLINTIWLYVSNRLNYKLFMQQIYESKIDINHGLNISIMRMVYIKWYGNGSMPQTIID